MYQHKIQYYETDKMGITHHSNYLRFMEEARTDTLEKAGFSYKMMEENKIFIPVISTNIEFKKPTTYGDVLDISVVVRSLSPTRFEVEYEMFVGDNFVCKATTNHCFLNENHRPVAITKANPDIYAVFENLLLRGEKND